MSAVSPTAPSDSPSTQLDQEPRCSNRAVATMKAVTVLTLMLMLLLVTVVITHFAGTVNTLIIKKHPHFTDATHNPTLQPTSYPHNPVFNIHFNIILPYTGFHPKRSSTYFPIRAI
jgi:hypothetical protein